MSSVTKMNILNPDHLKCLKHKETIKTLDGQINVSLKVNAMEPNK